MTLIEQVVHLRRSFHGILSRRIARVSDLSFQQILLLRIVERGMARTQAEAAERLLLDAAAVCRLAQRLEARGLLARARGADRRSIQLEVTEAALPHTALLAHELQRLEEQLRRGMTAEKAEMLSELLEEAQNSLDDSPL